MTTIDYKALAERLSRLADELAAFGHHTSEQKVDDLRTVVSLLEGMADKKPSAFAHRDAMGSPYVENWDDDIYALCGDINLYLHPAPQPIPEGWQLTPKAPTREMLNGARDWSIKKNGIGVGDDQAVGCFQAMLAAAPVPAPQPQPERQPMDAEAWAELHRLRAEAKGPDGYATWKEAAVSERIRRVRAEKQLTERQPVSEPTEAQIEARDALLDYIFENGTASEGVQHYLDRYVRAALAAKESK